LPKRASRRQARLARASGGPQVFMRSHAQVVVIGGGIVGCSVLYHLTKLGWRDVMLIERRELTAGSTWHAAAGFHAMNSDPGIASLQEYTIELYRELEEESGRAIGLHMTGGINLAGTRQRWEWLRAAWATLQTIGLDETRLVTPQEILELCPIVDIGGVQGGLYDPNEGHVDPFGTTQAFAAVARKRGAEVVLRNRVVALHPQADGAWIVVTEQGQVVAEHVVNAAGLWAKQVGLMAGVNLPVVPMEHHYLVTEEIPDITALSRELPIAVDLEGFTYLRQEGTGVLLGVYELNPKHWKVEGVPWDYGTELIPEDVGRIEPELAKGLERFPCVQRAGIKRWVNGAITFTPDGNPLVGPVPGHRNYWAACGVMAGFSQCGGIGRTLAEWIIQGEPSVDAFAMDVARYGEYASNSKYLKATTAQFYSRRFVLTYPNEQLPAGRPLRRPSAYSAMTHDGAHWGATWGLEVPSYFATPPLVETPSLRRSEAHMIVGRECVSSRNAGGYLDTSGFARYAVAGHGARAWLDHLLASQLPERGRVRLAPMLSESGRLLGDLTVLNWDNYTWWLMGTYALRAWHLRWFEQHPPGGDVHLQDISDAMAGFSIFGPKSRELLEKLTDEDVSSDAFRFMTCRVMDVGASRAHVARLSITGELGFEINVPAAEHLTLYETLRSVGPSLGMGSVGYNAVLSLRMEKSFGIWGRELGWAYTPRMSGLSRFVYFNKKGFIGREAALRERDRTDAAPVLVTLEVDAEDADASGYEPIWKEKRRVGVVTSGAYGHTVRKSLAMAYLDGEFASVGTELHVHIVGDRRPCRIIAPSPFDPHGERMRGC
jgi:dimethylglycine dehydrogenase